MENRNAECPFKVNDRVRRIDGRGCLGQIISIQHDIVTSAADEREKGVIVGVLWDNGTCSYFTPDGLELASRPSTE